MKIVLLSACLFLPFFSIKAQVSIGDLTPNTTLTIKESLDLEIPDGVIIPFLSKLDLANKLQDTYGINQISTIVYVSDITEVNTGESLSQVSEISKIGFYFLDSDLKWKAIQLNSQEFPIENIYSTDGLLTNDRIVNHNGYNLLFKSNLNNGFSIGSNKTIPTLTIDTNNNRVGVIGEGINNFPDNFPSTSFHIITKSEIETVQPPVYGLNITGPTNKDYILVSDKDGNGTWTPNIYRNVVSGSISNKKAFLSTNLILSHSLELTKGTWYVNLGCLVKSNGAGNTNNNMQINFSLTSSSSSISTSGFTFLSENSNVSGWLAPGYLPNGIGYNTIFGVQKINVTAESVTLYPYIKSINSVGQTTLFNPYIGIDTSDELNDFDDRSFFYATFVKSISN